MLRLFRPPKGAGRAWLALLLGILALPASLALGAGALLAIPITLVGLAMSIRVIGTRNPETQRGPHEDAIFVVGLAVLANLVALLTGIGFILIDLAYR